MAYFGMKVTNIFAVRRYLPAEGVMHTTTDLLFFLPFRLLLNNVSIQTRGTMNLRLCDTQSLILRQ
jgi:hypothetical protein